MDGGRGRRGRLRQEVKFIEKQNTDQFLEEVGTTNTEEDMKKKMMAEKSRGHRWQFLQLLAGVQVKHRHFNCLVHAGLSTLGHSAERNTLLFLEGPNTQRFHCKGYLLKIFKTFSNQKKPAFPSRLMVQSHDAGYKVGWVGSIPGSVLL